MAARRRSLRASKTEALSFLRACERALLVTTRATRPVSDSKNSSSRVCSPLFQAHSRKATRTGKERTRWRVKSLGLTRCSAMKAGSRRVWARSARILAWMMLSLVHHVSFLNHEVMSIVAKPNAALKLSLNLTALAMDVVRHVLKRLDLTLNEDKSRIVDARQPKTPQFHFMPIHFSIGRFGPVSPRRRQLVEVSIPERTHLLIWNVSAH